MVLSSLKKSSLDLLTHLRAFAPSKNQPSIQQHPQEKIALYGAYNLNACPWPQTPDGEYARKLLTPFIEKGVSQYIENIQTDLRVLIIDDLALPITINNAEYDNSYVCSPYSYFISYARESLDFLSQVWWRYTINALLTTFGQILRFFHLNKVVVVNNWLYSTNLYPQLNPEQVIRIAQFLQKAFPDSVLVFRSVDPYTNPVCYQTLQQVGFEYIAARQIFFMDPHHSSLFESRLFKSDLKLLKNSGYEIIEGEQLKEGDLPRLLQLYQDLYISKYSHLNPKFNQEFLRIALKENLFKFKVLTKGGSIDGVVGYMQRNGKMYCPFFGYDRQIPKEVALYRLLSTVLMLEAYEQGLFFHQSSGASVLKKIRKVDSCIEYIAVYSKHLNISRRFPWFMLKHFYNSLGKIYMERY